MNMSDFVQIAIGVLTLLGTVFAVRYEIRSRVDSLNKQVIELQDRKIALLTEQLNSERSKREEQDRELAALRQTVQDQAVLIARLERGGHRGAGGRAVGRDVMEATL